MDANFGWMMKTMETKQQLRDKIKQLEKELAVYKAREKRDQEYYKAYSKQSMEEFNRQRDLW